MATARLTVWKASNGLERFLIGAWLLWSVIAFCSGLGITRAIEAGVLLALQGLLGTRILSLTGLATTGGVIGMIGLGLAVGSGLSTLVFQLVLLGFSGAPPVLVVSLLVVGSYLGQRTKQRAPKSSEGESIEVAALLLVAILVLALTTGWHIAHALVMILSIALTSFFKKRAKRISKSLEAMVLFLPVAIFGVWFRQAIDLELLSRILWDGDNSIFQMLINTTARWGIMGNAAVAGQSPIAGYHWASFGWMGLLEGSISGAPWLTLQFLTPIATSVVLSAMLWQVALETGASLAQKFVAVVFALALFFRPDGSISLFVSDMWLVALVLLIWKVLGSDQLIRATPLLTVMMICVLTGKRTSGILMIASLVAASLFALVLLKKRTSFRIAQIAILFVVVLVVDQVLISVVQRIVNGSGLNLVTGSGRVWLNFISEDAFGYVGTLSGFKSVVGALFVTLSIFFLFFVAIGIDWLGEYEWQGRVVTTFSAVVVSAVAPVFLAGERLAVFVYSRHVGIAVGSIVVLLGILHFFEQESETSDRSRLVYILLASVVVGVAWLLLFETQFARSLVNWRVIIRDAIWIPVLLLTGVLLVLMKPLRSSRQGLSVALIAGTMITGVLSMPKMVDEIINERIRPLIAKEFVNPDLDFPTEDINSVGRWARENTHPDVIFASNYFCESRRNFNLDCAPELWWQNWIDRANSIDAFNSQCRVETAEELGRVQNYLLPALAERRFLVSGPGFSLGCASPPRWISERIVLSEQFARHPSLSSCMKLVDEGVSYFIVDRRTSDVNSWGNLASTKLDNQSFLVLQLNDGYCSKN